MTQSGPFAHLVDDDGFRRYPTEAELRAHWIAEAAAARGPRGGAAMMRSLAFSGWCPPCQDGDHWNHAPRPRFVASADGPVPDAGGCWSVQRIGGPQPCRCAWRPR